MKNICFQMTRKAWLVLALTLCCVFPALAQKITVKGTVIDTYGDPLIGATVMAQGTTVGVATDFDGVYSIEVAPNASLVFSYVGMDPQTIAVNGRTQIDVTLKENSVVLNEVVAIGYGTVKKSDATGSVAVVKPDEVQAGLATTAQDLLVGATPGVVVTTTGNPSEGGNIRIRGGASLNASNDPLIVIDGVPMDNGGVKGSSNPLGLISPENIESMTVLKDASATAIYGSRASNGVIIITTKKGQSGKPQVNFAANMYINTPRKTLNMMKGDEYRQFVIDTFGADSQAAGALGDAVTDWQDQVLRTSVSSDYNLSVGGALGAVPYRVAVGYTNNNGIIRPTSMDRATASINLTPKFFDGLLQINANVKGAYVENHYEQGVLGGAVSFNPTLPIREDNWFSNWTTYTAGGSTAGIGTSAGALNTLAAKNPVSRMMDFQSIGKSWQSIGNLQIDLRMPFLRELRANLNLGYDYADGKNQNHQYPFTPEAWSASTYVPKLVRNADGGWSQVVIDDVLQEDQLSDGYTSINYEKQKRYNLLLEFYLNYNKDFDAIKSSLDVTAGYSWQRFSNKGHNWSQVYAPQWSAQYFYDYNEQFNPGRFTSVGDAAQYLKLINGYQRSATYYYSSPYQLVSFFGRLQYGFMDKYLLTFTMRQDGSSRFADGNRWGSFPSVALAWRLIDEGFMDGTRGWLSDLKIRGTWGITGQQNLGDGFDMVFPYLPVYNISNDLGTRVPFPVEGYDGIFQVTPQKYNAALKWEETTTWNVGVDFGFLNNRINGSVEWYKRTTKDLLVTQVTYPAGSNFGPEGPMNLGDLENTGLEFNLITRPIVNKNFQWTSSLNVAWNKNKITKLGDGSDVPTGNVGNNVNVQLQREGEAAYSFYVYEQVYNPDGTPAEGVYVDRNGDGNITEADKYIYHSKDPKVTLNWQNTFNYKNWDFGFALRASLGNWVYNQNQKDNSFVSAAQVPPISNLMANTYLFTSTRSTELVASDYWVQNASFLRCDNITIGYTWNKLFNDMRLRLYGAVQNPFVITKYKGIDPEVFGGIDSSIYPKPLTVSLGVVATF
ncbi:MAG: TonB-dependent receptor [Muribaculaceae bacterium]|nr:TonB-dependent receptor [Muribaculaceae bacterium]